MKRIYVAGPYSANNVMAVLDNMREGMRLSTRVLLAGYAPFCPWLDFHFQLMLKEHECLSVNDFYKYSSAWLYVSDAMLLLPNYKTSEGTLAEIVLAEQNHIPIFFDLETLQQRMPA